MRTGLMLIFWRGKVTFIEEYEAAVKSWQRAFASDLKSWEFNFIPRTSPRLEGPHKGPSNGRIVFVATPRRRYGTIVPIARQGAGGRGIPCYARLQARTLGTLWGTRCDPSSSKRFLEAEASIHLLGKRTGGRPDGLDMDIVPMQLVAAAEETKRKPGFERMIWAPVVLPGNICSTKTARRDPLEVLGRFGQQLLPTDQIDSDTASRFNQFVLQHLADVANENKVGRQQSSP